jgi:hypothetical protein
MNIATASKGADHAPQPTVRSSQRLYIHGDEAAADGADATEMGSIVVLKRYASVVSRKVFGLQLILLNGTASGCRARKGMLKA